MNIYKRFSVIIFVFIILISFLGMSFLHNGFNSHCPFCSKGTYSFDYIAGSFKGFFAYDRNFQLISIENTAAIPSIADSFIAVRASPF